MAERNLGVVAQSLLVFLGISLFLGVLALGYHYWESGIGPYLVGIGVIYSILLLALVAILGELIEIKVSLRRQDRVVRLLGNIYNSIQSFQAEYPRKTTDIELGDADDTEDKKD